ncbi:MAG: S-methyl-5-thioribose-1-phosphate isomerase [Clostridiales bacterium]|nr:S-methyl-5-thioribose-1-phosphate isomerase [Clostridiales bacterium]
MKTIEYKENQLILLDQRKLPVSREYFVCSTYKDVEFAIKDMVVRGAPAIGATAAYGVVLAALEFENNSREDFAKNMAIACERLNDSRPTAVNLMWAIKRMKKIISKNDEVKSVCNLIKAEADYILREDINTNKRMARAGSNIIMQGAKILTHCNTGALATAGYGTALGVIREAHYSGKNIYVYADETRPRLQGARLTAWELKEENIPFTLIADSTAATLIRDGKVDVILVGADRIALNGDTANKIGTFMLSVVAKRYNIPFYIVAPTTTIDFEIETGEEIEIEERSSEEITHIVDVRIAPADINVYNPAFDVTPNEFITGIITEKGILKSPYNVSIPKCKDNSSV